MKKFYVLFFACLLLSASVFAQNIGISDNIFTPQSPLHIHRTSDGNLLQLTNPTTTNAAGRGLLIQVLGNDFSIINQEAGFIRFHTNNLERIRITSAGNVGIGTAAPDARLNVFTIYVNERGISSSDDGGSRIFTVPELGSGG